jgi:hypothetical protein
MELTDTHDSNGTGTHPPRCSAGGSYTELCDFIVYFFVDYALGLAFASFMISMALPVAEQMELYVEADSQSGL